MGVTKNTTDLFILRSKEVHGDKYDYSLSVYTHWSVKIKVICRVHGVWEMSPDQHMSKRKRGCPKCAREAQIKRNRRFTNEEILAFAKSCESYYDFQSNHRDMYSFAYRRNLLGEIRIFLKPGDVYGIAKRCIYVYEFDDNHAYVGLTCNLEKRDTSRFSNKYKDSVVSHKETTGASYVLKKLTDYVPQHEARLLESEFIAKYKQTGWNILNKKPGGALGKQQKKWTKEKCEEIASKFSTRKELKNFSMGCYTAIMNNKWNHLFNHMHYVYPTWAGGNGRPKKCRVNT